MRARRAASPASVAMCARNSDMDKPASGIAPLPSGAPASRMSVSKVWNRVSPPPSSGGSRMTPSDKRSRATPARNGWTSACSANRVSPARYCRLASDTHSSTPRSRSPRGDTSRATRRASPKTCTVPGRRVTPGLPRNMSCMAASSARTAAGALNSEKPSPTTLSSTAKPSTGTNRCSRATPAACRASSSRSARSRPSPTRQPTSTANGRVRDSSGTTS